MDNRGKWGTLRSLVNERIGICVTIKFMNPNCFFFLELWKNDCKQVAYFYLFRCLTQSTMQKSRDCIHTPKKNPLKLDLRIARMQIRLHISSHFKFRRDRQIFDFSQGSLHLWILSLSSNIFGAGTQHPPHRILCFLVTEKFLLSREPFGGCRSDRNISRWPGAQRRRRAWQGCSWLLFFSFCGKGVRLGLVEKVGLGGLFVLGLVFVVGGILQLRMRMRVLDFQTIWSSFLYLWCCLVAKSHFFVFQTVPQLIVRNNFDCSSLLEVHMTR